MAPAVQSYLTDVLAKKPDEQAVLAESIVWDPTTERLRWTDITLGLLTTARADGTVESSVALPPPLASFQPRAAGGFVAALGDTVVLTDERGVVERELVRVHHATTAMRFNEGKCDPFGRFLVGSMDLSDEDPAGALYSIEPDGTTRVLRGGFGVTNGIEWSADGSVMYVTDTSTSTIYRGAYSPEGDLGELEPFVSGATAPVAWSGGTPRAGTWRPSRCRLRTSPRWPSVVRTRRRSSSAPRGRTAPRNSSSSTRTPARSSRCPRGCTALRRPRSAAEPRVP